MGGMSCCGFKSHGLFLGCALPGVFGAGLLDGVRCNCGTGLGPIGLSDFGCIAGKDEQAVSLIASLAVCFCKGMFLGRFFNVEMVHW